MAFVMDKLTLQTIFLILGLASFVQAQNYIQVYDAETFNPLPYANIAMKELSSGESKQTASDENGKFTVPFESETQIDISYIGYESFSKIVRPGRSNILYLFSLETKVDEVVVTGASTETTSKESMFDVNVIAKEELEKRAAVSLSDALMNELNVQISRDGILGSQVNLQGLGGNNVKIMIDGVPVIGRLDGNLDLSQINMNGIERIEVVEGPLSAIYGSNAIAGVINLISKQSQKNSVESSLNGYYESIGTYNVDAFVGFKRNQHSVQLNGGRYFFDGWNPTSYDRDMQWNPKEQYFGGLNYVYRTTNNWFHKFKANYFLDRILNRYDPTGSLPTAFDDWYNTTRVDGNYSITGKFSDHLSLNSVNGYNHYNRIKNRYQKDLSTLETTLVEDTQFDDNQDTTMANQWMTRTYLSWDNPEKIVKVQAGIDFNIENGVGGRFSDEDGSSAVMADLAGFVSTHIAITEKLSVQPAIRYGYNSQFRVLPTPSLQLKAAINSQLTYRLNYGMGFRAPSLKEMYLIFNDANHNIFGNTNLTPEQSQNVSTSISYEQKRNLHRYQINSKLFYNYKYNAIALTPDENNIFQYVNIGKFTTMGIQVDGKYSFKNLNTNFGFSYTGISNQSYSRQADEPKYFFYLQLQANATYFISKANLSFSLFNKWNGSRKDFRLVGLENEPEQIQIEGFNLMDFTVQKGFWGNRIRINAGVKNLLDIRTINGGSSSGGVHTGGDQGTLIAAGRTYFIGLNIGSK
jgi:outer membrane receptor for ferrienterochelin and colicins